MIGIGSPKWREIIQGGGAAFGVEISDAHLDDFAVHAEELVLWNRAKNLSSITDPFEVAVKHFVDALAAVPHIPQTASVLDIGSGGGFPGMVLKIMRPDSRILLIDAVRKKVNFLKHVIRKLEVPKIEARHVRAEDLAGEVRFDVVICRAFSALDLFFVKAIPLLEEEGFALAMKGKADEKEIRAADSFLAAQPRNWEMSRQTYDLPFSDSHRSLFYLKPG